MKETCRLCRREADLRVSHLVPSFVFRWMKSTGTGYLRQAGSPNIRKQDGSKQELLCESCEQLLGSDESWFRTNIFEVYLKNIYVLPYNHQLFRFCISLAWRALVTTDRDYIDKTGFRTHCDEISERWRQFLLKETDASALPESHLFLTDIAAEGDSIPIKNFSTYFARTVDSSIAHSSNRCFMYVKFARFMFFSAITPPTIDRLESTRIDPSGGTISTPQACHDGDIGAFLLERARDSNEMFQSGLSDKQRSVINQNVKINREKFVNSDLGRAALADHLAEVDPHGFVRYPVARNDKCPCGSGRKYKNCCMN